MRQLKENHRRVRAASLRFAQLARELSEKTREYEDSVNAQDSALHKSLELEELLEKLPRREVELVTHELSSIEAQEAASSFDFDIRGGY